MPFTTVKQKLTASNLFNCSDLSMFIASIVQTLHFKGVSLSLFYICEFEGVRFLTKVSFYRKTYPELYGKTSKNVIPHVDAEINILRIFKEKIIDKNLTPCILELVYSKICKGLNKLTPGKKACERLMIDYRDTSPGDDIEQLICRYIDFVKNGLAHDKCAFLVLEKCDISFDEFLIKSINTSVSLAIFKSLLFQIIYTIYVINRLYPRFHHYDLHTENIMLKFDPNHKFKATNPKFLVFIINGEKYSVPYFGIIPKIIDFGYSVLPEEGIISNIVEDRIAMYTRSDNDLVFLFHWIHEMLSRVGGDKLGHIDKILEKLEPNRTFMQYHPEYIRKIAKNIPTYREMVENPIWYEYKKFKATGSQIYNEFTPIEDVIRK